MKTARRVYLTLSLMAVLGSFGGCSAYEIQESIKRDEYFRKQQAGDIQFAGPYCFPDPHPNLLRKIALSSFLTLLLLVFVRRAAWSLPLLALSNYWYWTWFASTQSSLDWVSAFGRPVDYYLLQAGIFDIAAGVSTLLLTLTILVLGLYSLVKPSPKQLDYP